MTQNPQEKIYWHGAFYVVAEAELIDYKDDILIENEHHLSKEALKIDVLVIKKNENVQIKKNIGRIFKGHNILEYKSPADSLTISDYHKINGYAYLYSAFNHVEINDITLTFVVSTLSPKLREYLVNARGFTLTEEEQGILYLEGDTFAVQIIEQQHLNSQNNVFLRNLQKDVEATELLKVIAAFDRQGKLDYKNRYLQAMVNINPKEFEEAIKMVADRQEVNDVLIRMMHEHGIAQKWATDMAIEIAKKMLRIGEPLEKISLITDLDIKTIETLQL